MNHCFQHQNLAAINWSMIYVVSGWIGFINGGTSKLSSWKRRLEMKRAFRIQQFRKQTIVEMTSLLGYFHRSNEGNSSGARWSTFSLTQRTNQPETVKSENPDGKNLGNRENFSQKYIRKFVQSCQFTFSTRTSKKEKTKSWSGKTRKFYFCLKVYWLAMDDRTIDTIFQGSLENLPPVSSKIVRIFTSSTFTGKLSIILKAFKKWISHDFFNFLRHFDGEKQFDVEMLSKNQGLLSREARAGISGKVVNYRSLKRVLELWMNESHERL